MGVLKRFRLPITLLVIALVGWGAIHLATSESSLQFAGEELKARLHDEMGLTLEFGEVAADPEQAKFRVAPVVVKDLDGETLFSAKSVALELKPLGFFTKKVTLKTLEIEEPSVFVRINDGKVAGLKGLPDDGGESAPPLFVEAEHLRVTGGRVRVVVDGKVETKLSGVRARLKSRGEDGHKLRFHVESSSLIRRGDDGAVLSDVKSSAFDGRLAVFGAGLLAPERVSVSDITIATADAELSVAGNILLGDGRLLPSVDLDVTGVCSLPALNEHLPSDPQLRGDLRVSARVSSGFGGKRLRATGRVEIERLSLLGHPIGGVAGPFEVTQAGLKTERLEVFTAGTRMLISGGMKFDDNLSFSGTAKGEGASLGGVLEVFKKPGAWVDGVVDGEVAGEGTLLPKRLVVNGTARINKFRLATRNAREVPLGEELIAAENPIEAKVNINVNDDRVRFEGTAGDGLTQAEGVVKISLAGDGVIDIEAKSERVDWSSVGHRLANLRFNGVGAAKLKVSGTSEDPQIAASAWLRDFSLNEFAFGDLDGQIRYRRQLLSFLDVTATKNNSVYAGDVVLDFQREVQIREVVSDPTSPMKTARGLHIDIDVNIEDAQAEDLREVIPARSEGVLSFIKELELFGPVRGPLQGEGFIEESTDLLIGEGNLEFGAGATLLGQTLAGGSGRMLLEQDRFVIDGLKLDVAGGAANVDATVDRWSNALAGRFSLRELQLAGINALQDTSRTFSGTVSAEGRLSEVANDPGFNGRGVIRGAAWGEIPIGDADLELEHRGRSLTARGPMLSGRGRGEIVVETRSPFPYTASVQLKNGAIAPLLPKDLLPEGASGRVAGSVDAFGRLKGFSDSRGTVTLTTTKARFRSLELEAAGDVLAHFRGSQLTVDQLEMSSETGDALRLRGVVGSDKLDLQLSARGEIGWAPAFFDRVETAAGQFDLELAIAGQPGEASLTGTGRVHRGSLTVRGFEHVVRDLDARLAFRGPELVVKSASAKVGGGSAALDGKLILEGTSVRRYDLNLDYARVDLHVPSWLASRSSGQLRFVGDSELPTLSGDVKVHEAIYEEDVNWERLLPDLRRRVDNVRTFDKADEDIRFDVHLYADKNLAVRNNVIDVEGKGDLYLVGTEERPGLRGNVTVIGGTATFRNNRYRLAGGNVEFTDHYRIAPSFNLEAETRVRDYDIRARVIGALSDVRVELDSSPQLAETDILSLLTLGFTQFELADNDTTTGFATGLEVVSAYTGLEDEVRRLLPGAVSGIAGFNVNELRLTSQFSTSVGQNVPAVAVGFELDPSIALLGGSHLRLQSTIIDVGGNGVNQSVEWEKRFDNDLRLRVVWRSQDRGACPNCLNDFGDPGLDLWYRWEF